MQTVPASPSQSVPENDARAERALGWSLAFAGIRCVLQYAFLPFVLPILGITGAVATPISLAINLVAMISLVYSIRRMWQIGYKHKWLYTGVGTVAFIVLVAFIALDLQLIRL